LQIKCALDEWKDGVRTTIPFSAQEYRAVYQQILRLIASVEANEFHAAKFLRGRRDWADLWTSGSLGLMGSMDTTITYTSSYDFYDHRELL
jgi:Domain of unknown function (DUF6532)